MGELHAIEDVGRARTEMRAQLLDGDLYEQAHHAAGVLAASHGHALHVHADLATRAQIERLEPAQLLGPAGEPSILVVEEDGTVSPMCHGFDRGWRVAELGRQRLRDGMACFVGDGDDRSGAGRLRELIGSTRDSLLASSRSVYDFVAELRRASNRTATEVDSVPVAVRVGG